MDAADRLHVSFVRVFIVLQSIAINPDLFPFLSKSPFSVPFRAVNVSVLCMQCHIPTNHPRVAALGRQSKPGTDTCYRQFNCRCDMNTVAFSADSR